MAKILVIDDNATNRKLVVTLLGFQGHRTFEAIDGADGLASARAEQPDLVISDMPTMDGYEFVRQLRADIKLSTTAVILYTAHYHEREARKLAEACRVARVLTKPCATADLVQAVEDALTGSVARVTEPVAESFDRKHLHLITNKLSQKAGELEVANARLAALTDLNVQLASERDPRVLLEKVCYGARHLIGSKYAVLAVAAKSGADALIFSTSGIEFRSQAAARPRLDAGLLGRVVAERRALRASNADSHAIDVGLPPTYPPACAFVAAPLISLTQTFGWVCLADKIGAGAFCAEDERILSVLAAQSVAQSAQIVLVFGATAILQDHQLMQSIRKVYPAAHIHFSKAVGAERAGELLRRGRIAADHLARQRRELEIEPGKCAIVIRQKLRALCPVSTGGSGKYMWIVSNTSTTSLATGPVTVFCRRWRNAGGWVTTIQHHAIGVDRRFHLDRLICGQRRIGRRLPASIGIRPPPKALSSELSALVARNVTGV